MFVCPTFIYYLCNRFHLWLYLHTGLHPFKIEWVKAICEPTSVDIHLWRSRSLRWFLESNVGTKRHPGNIPPPEMFSDGKKYQRKSCSMVCWKPFGESPLVWQHYDFLLGQKSRRGGCNAGHSKSIIYSSSLLHHEAIVDLYELKLSNSESFKSLKWMSFLGYFLSLDYCHRGSRSL